MRQTWKPSSLGDRSYWAHVAEAPEFATWREGLARALVDIPALPTLPTAADYLAAARHNNRNRVDTAGWKRRSAISALVANRCLQGFDLSRRKESGEFEGQDDRLLEWIWAYLSHPTWAVVAHFARRDLPALTDPITIDLAACEQALVMAEGREILKPWMDAVSGTLADSVQSEVLRRVIRPFAEDHPALRLHGWAHPETVHNNWTGVCAGAMVAACESLLAQGASDDCLVPARNRALDLLNTYLDKAFTAHAECDEGIGYWMYGISLACCGWMRLDEKTLASRVNLDRLRQVADYPRRVHLFGDTFFGHGDAGTDYRPNLGWAWWLAETTGLDWLAEWCRNRGSTNVLKGIPPWRDLVALERMHVAKVFGGGHPAAAPGGEADPLRGYLPDQQAAFFRLSTAAGEMVATLAGGHNGQSHNHNDVGHVNLWMQGQPVLVDLGCPEYTADFFGPRRYEYLAAGSRGHNVPVVNGCEQRSGRAAAALVLEKSRQCLELDLTATYPPESKLLSWVRALDAGADGLTLTDTFQLDSDGEIELRFWSLAEPVGAAGVVRLGAVVVLHDPAPASVAVETVRAGDHRLVSFKADQRLHCHRAVYRIRGGISLAIRTRLVPA